MKETCKSRSMILEKESKNLKIWDYLEEEYLYDGKVNLDEEGDLINDEYYQIIFWRELPLQPGYGNDGRTAQYEDKQTF